MNYADRAKETTVGTGTGNLALAGAPTGYRTLASVFAASQRFLYVVEDTVSGQWEIGFGYVSGGALIRETPVEGSSSTPVSFGAGTKNVFIAHNAVLSMAMHMALFGGGRGGDSVVTGAVSQGGDGHYQNLTISGAGKINAAGCRVLVRSVLDLNSGGASAIHNNGADGASAVLDVAGIGGKAGTSMSLGQGTSGGTGANGGAGAGAQGSASTALSNSTGGSGGAGGAGGSGNGGANAGGASKAGGAASNPQSPGIFEALVADTLGTGMTIIGGGTGGGGGSAGGGDGGNGGGGGGGGGAGGVLEVRAAVLKVSGSASITATGGAGGNGGTPAAGNRGGGGGGAGGGGGYIRLIVGYVIGTAGAKFLSARGGNGGNGGSKTGTGVDGQGGDGGNGGIIDAWNLSLGTWVRTTGSTGSPHNAQAGGGGGDAYGTV